ncbi:DNRLRE domain-containing protein [Streptomyces sp. C10-9-1]|uniref:DNRLRE domain-containing protein n=1 Tax=Streptomyces sp. C10-9-1 TaxID=1859285 RepID=UPI0021116C0B|nr:DNRLRE domain-containing protein [Streptomyces sp. C10-9-1]MCQ6556518.1 DNRLRE domain-containing protein [Streptomyces sp. C10-9-1]
MGASKSAEQPPPAEAAAEDPGHRRAPAPGRPGRRLVAALSALLAVAVAVPVAVHLTGTEEARPADAKPSAPKAPLTAAEAMKRAKATGKEVEVEAERDSDSITWAQPDGMFRLVQHSDTFRAKVDGVWKPIDTTLERVEGGYAPKAVNQPLLFSAGTADRASRALGRAVLAPAAPGAPSGPWSDLVRLTAEGHELVVRWPGPLPEPVVDGGRALYRDVRPDIDLLLTARDGGYSHVLILHTRKASRDPLLAELAYRLESPDLSFRLDKASNVVTAHDAEGRDVAAAPTPYLWDSAGERRVTLGEPSPPGRPADPALGLPGLAGPQPGSHDAVLKAGLEDGLHRVEVPRRFLDDEDTVYPVFVDPSFRVHRSNWTLLYDRYKSSSFWNGQNFNDGTHEARVGYESTTGGLSRSVFQFKLETKLHDATVRDATFTSLQTYSWGCSARRYNLHRTGTISPTSTWNNQPGWAPVLAHATNGWGYNSGSCPDKWVGLDITSAAQDAAKNNWAYLNFGLRAANEADTNSWKKFQANGESSPYITIVYNHAPDEPVRSSMVMDPGGTCDSGSPPPTIGSKDVTFTAKSSDTDGNLAKLRFKVWAADGSGIVLDQQVATNSSGAAFATVARSQFTDKKTYTWTVLAIDSEGSVSPWGPAGTYSYCGFVVDSSVPGRPDVSSADFPQQSDEGDVWSAEPFGTPGDFTLSPQDAASDGVVRYVYSFDSNDYDQQVTAQADGTAVISGVQPHFAGPNTLYVRAVDAGGNMSSVRVHTFYVRPRGTLDAPGDVTGDGYPDLLAVDGPGNLRTYPADATGDVNIHMPGAHLDGKDLAAGYWSDAEGNPALISHSTDWHPGDGITDVLARMPDGKLYVYPGDGYGAVEVSERLEVLLPENAPDPASFTQVLATGDVTGDGRPDALVVAADQLWAFTGYSGASFAETEMVGSVSWSAYDLVGLRDISGDGLADLLMRGPSTSAGLLLRKGKPDPDGGVDFRSFSSPSSGAGGAQVIYGTTGWGRDDVPMILGTPDVTGDADGIPDLWAVRSDGTLRLYPGGRTSLGSGTLVGEQSWTTLKALG